VRPLKSGLLAAAPARLAALAAAAVLVISACGALSGVFRESRDPQPCEWRFNAVRCLAMTDYAAFQLSTTREDIASLVVLPEPTLEVRDGKTILQVRSGGPPIDVLVTLADGSTHQVSMHCVGVATRPACSNEPRLRVQSGTDGYHDTPAGSTPVPPPAAEAIADARALRIERLDISIDHTGLHEVRLGEASLPNGLLTAAEFELVDDWPPGITIIEGTVRLEVRSLVTGERLWNVYAHGRVEGTEPVEAVLVFDVFRFDPGAVLSIRSVLIR